MKEVMLKAHEIAKAIETGPYKLKLAAGLRQAWSEWRNEKMLDSLKNMSTEELENLINKATKILGEKKRANVNEFEFEFSATCDPRKGKPFVARLYWGEKDGKQGVQRDFFDLDRQWGKKEITVSGTYKAKAGDIVEKRTGGSWKNDYRAWYYISENAEEICVADIDNSEDKARVVEYLKGKITAEELTKAIRPTGSLNPGK